MADIRSCIYPILLFCLLCNPSTSYRILGLFPFPIASHFAFIHPIMRELADAGHNVTVISYFPDSTAPANYKDIELKAAPLMTNTFDLDMFKHLSKLGGFVSLVNVLMMFEMGNSLCEAALNTDTLKQIAEAKKEYDVIMLEYFCNECMLGIAWKLQLPVIGLTSSALMPWHYNSVGNPHHTGYIPSVFTAATDEMTFSTRIWNWFNVHVLPFVYRQFHNRAADSIIRKALGIGIPSVTELVKNTSIIFINQHYSLSGAKPLSPAVIEIGGIHIKDAQPLDENLQKMLDEATNGVVFVSWGSMIRASTLPDEKREELLQAFGSLKQLVIWKYENDTIPNKPDNVYIGKWFPQKDILCHPNALVFVTHGGLGGSSESAYCGVPVVVTPLYGDQGLNAAALVGRGMGRIVLYPDISKQSMQEAIEFALQPSIRENAQKVSKSYRNRITSPKETVVWWVEHVIESGGSPFTKSHSTFMPIYSFYLLDVYAAFFAGCVISASVWVWLIRLCCCRRTTKTNKVKTN